MRTNQDHRKILNLVIIFIVTLGLLSAVEISSYYYLSMDFSEKPLFINNKAYKRVPRFKVYSEVDPLLGWTIHSQEAPGYHVLREGRGDSFKVMILGGSTTDHYYDDYHPSWVQFLFEKIQQNYKDFTIYNGGVAGYTSSQETLKVLRDIDILSPDLIIAYDGVNEDKYFTLADHPYVSEHIHTLLSYHPPFFPNTIEALKVFLSLFNINLFKTRLNLGPTSKAPAEVVWINNHKKMNHLAKYAGARYIGILQPHFWSGKYRPSPEEREQVSTFHKKGYQEFYSKAIAYTEKEEFMIDGTGFLNDTTGVYYDDCHLVTHGQKVIASQIYDIIIKDIQELYCLKNKCS